MVEMTRGNIAWFLASLALCSASYDLDVSQGLGRVFDGIGAISGGGATSKLLVSYPEKERNEILDYLFKPNFGASLHMLKVEIGGDAQSSDGTESSHMHESWDENYNRGYEWWLMKEAKKRNPNIKLLGLSWAFPGWVGEGNNPYKYPNKTALYIVKWVLGAKKFHGLDIDYVGLWNERHYDIKYVKTLKETLKSHGLDSVKIIVSDSDWWVSKDILKDPTFAAAVDVIGAHYPGTESTPEAVATGKALWSAEDFSTFNDDVGAGCLARVMNHNYVTGKMTSTIAWNLVAAYYDNLPFGRDGLMTANEPWSGNYVVTSPIWIAAHTTQFTNAGWRYLGHGAGVGMLDFGGSYVTLVSPDGKDFTTIIETMTRDQSECIRPELPDYNVTAQQAEFFLRGKMAGIKKLNVWKTDLKEKQYFQKIAPIRPALSSFRLALEPNQVYTLTTLTVGNKGSYEAPPSSEPFPTIYYDDYEGYAEFSEPRFFVPQLGVWEIRKENGNPGNNVNRQVILSRPINWCQLAGDYALSVGGDHKWTDVDLSMDILIPSLNGTAGSFLAARVNEGGCEAANTDGIYFAVYPGNSTYALYCKTDRSCILDSGNIDVPIGFNTWHKLRLSVKSYSKATRILASLDDYVLLKTTVSNISTNGFVGYGTTTFGYGDFDNLSIN